MILNYSKQFGKKILITEKSKSFYINLEDITYISCDKTVSTVHVMNKKETYSMAKLLKNFEKYLEDCGFIRANRNTLVNIKYLSAIHVENGRKHITINNIDIIVPKRKVSLFKGR